ncbi:MAG: VCBS domain-containing protein, partial [Halodesulfovibrio sp.]|uniref:VCBS domain-containing protein n=1 Tax=Halodesulfovibrio sp. TaxID=1912772 RepID=UPI00359DCA92
MVAQIDNDKNIQVLKKPVAGEVREVVVGSELDVSFDFDLDSVQAAKDGDDLVLTFEDESVLKLLDFASELEPVDVVLQDGTVLSAEAIMEAIGDDGFIDTAAGSTPSSPQGSGSSNIEGFGEALGGIENQEINHSYDDSSRATISSDETGAENTPVVAVDDSSSVLAEELTNILDGTANPSVSGNVLANEIDPDGDTLSVTGSTSNAQYGTFVINKDGTWTYTLDNQNGDIVALDDGESRTDSITYTVSDGLSSDTATLTVTINGTNDAPTVVADAGEVTAEEYHDVNAGLVDVPTASGNVLNNDSDLDIEAISVLDPGTYDGSYGTLVITESGSWTYTLDHNNSDVQGLSEDSDPLQETFKYSASDGTASTESELVIDVHGTNDRPEVISTSADVTGTVTEDVSSAAVAQGTLQFTDVDN